MSTNNSYRIYVACLASYNAGRLHGEWFDLEDYNDADELQEAIAEKVLRTSAFPNVMVDIDCPTCDGEGVVQYDDQPEVECACCAGKGTKSVPSAEEYAVHDYDSEVFTNCGEHPNFEELFSLMEMTEKHGDAWVAFKNYFGDDVTEEQFENANRGAWDSFEAFVEDWVCGLEGWQGSESFYGWIDWQRAARDYEGDFTYTEGYVFDNNW